MVEVYGFNTYLAWSDLAMSLYLLINLLLLFLLMLCTCRCGTPCGQWCSKLWERRSIYSPIVLQFLDQATDIGVVILWVQLALEERDDNNEFEVESVSVTLFAGLSVIAFCIYRIIIIILACIADNYDGRRCVPLFLSFFDLVYIYEIYFVHKNDLPELSEDMRNYQLFQCMFESVPQVVFQSVFLLRTWPNRNTIGNDQHGPLLYQQHEYLLISSIIISVLNICNKYAWRDQHTQWVEHECRLFGGNFRHWLLHVLWRTSHIVARVILIVMMWSILGGLMLSSFWLIVFIIFMICFNKFEYDPTANQEFGIDPTFKDMALAGIRVFIFEHVVGMTGDETPSTRLLGFRIMLRLCEYIVGIGLIWSFIEYRDILTCPKYVCSSADNRDWDENEMIEIYFFIELGAVVLDFVFFIWMFSIGLIQTNNGQRSTVPGVPAINSSELNDTDNHIVDDTSTPRGFVSNTYGNEYRNSLGGNAMIGPNGVALTPAQMPGGIYAPKEESDNNLNNYQNMNNINNMNNGGDQVIQMEQMEQLGQQIADDETGGQSGQPGMNGMMNNTVVTNDVNNGPDDDSDDDGLIGAYNVTAGRDIDDIDLDEEEELPGNDDDNINDNGNNNDDLVENDGMQRHLSNEKMAPERINSVDKDNANEYVE